MHGQLYVDQALHGYADGHQLLASSVPLTSEQQSYLLLMSDLSGLAYEPQFDGYLTAYPVPGSGLYCIAKTWYAVELPRPGCVWTHSILVGDENLAQIPDLRVLLPLFARPGGNDFTSYTQPLHLTPHVGKAFNVALNLVIALLRELYTTKSAVIVESRSAKRHEDAVIAIFNQQWPRLRRNFRFSTGILSLRENIFDLAIVPPQVASSKSDDIVIIAGDDLDGMRAPDADQNDWTFIIAQDLISNDQPSELKQFLWRYGPDYSDGRGAFRALSEIYIASSLGSATENVEQALSAVGFFFPEQTASGRLKLDFFGSSGRYSHVYGGEEVLLKALVTHPGGDSDCG